MQDENSIVVSARVVGRMFREGMTLQYRNGPKAAVTEGVPDDANLVDILLDSNGQVKMTFDKPVRQPSYMLEGGTMKYSFTQG